MNNRKKYRETREWERLAISLRKLEILGTFNARMVMIKDRNSKDLSQRD